MTKKVVKVNHTKINVKIDADIEIPTKDLESWKTDLHELIEIMKLPNHREDTVIHKFNAELTELDGT